MDTKTKTTRLYFVNREGEKIYIRYPVIIPSPPGFVVALGETNEQTYTLEKNRIQVEN
jgi:hypothetical protein